METSPKIYNTERQLKQDENTLDKQSQLHVLKYTLSTLVFRNRVVHKKVGSEGGTWMTHMYNQAKEILE